MPMGMVYVQVRCGGGDILTEVRGRERTTTPALTYPVPAEGDKGKKPGHERHEPNPDMGTSTAAEV
jgi:hypothetical protein